MVTPQSAWTWLIKRFRLANPNDLLSSKGAFEIDSSHRKTIKQELESRQIFPTKNQWDLILSRADATLVNAGAGSGKTTSLINRIVVLHCFLKVPLRYITVFSFTRKSTADFRKKLRETLRKFDVEISSKQAGSVVRTFHSKLVSLSPSVGDNVFDMLDMETKERSANSSFSIEALRVGPKQDRRLRDAYQLSFADDRFRCSVNRLYAAHLKRVSTKRFSRDANRQFARLVSFDRERTERVHELFKWPGSDNPVSMTVSKYDKKYQFYANGYDEHAKVYLVFVPKAEVLEKYGLAAKERFALAKSLEDKELLLAKYCEHRVRFVSTQRELDIALEEFEFAKRSDGPEFWFSPVVMFAPEGEKYENFLWRTFYGMGQFIESLGLEVSQVCNAALGLEQDEVSAIVSTIAEMDREFLVALAVFWKQLDLLLEQEGKLRFSQLFAEQANRAELGAIGPVDSMRHVIVDEFQDISPEVVRWIGNIQQDLRRREIGTTIMCVGDDWQSIYGWRGSSPHFITEKERELGLDRAQLVTLDENFRCGQQIIDCAERVLRRVKIKAEKKREVAD